MKTSVYEACSRKPGSFPILCCICLTSERSTCCHVSGLRMWSTQSTDSSSRTGWTPISRRATRSLQARTISWSTWIPRLHRLWNSQLKSAVSLSLNLIVCFHFSDQRQGRPSTESWFETQKIYRAARWVEGRWTAQGGESRRTGSVEQRALTKTWTSAGIV